MSPKNFRTSPSLFLSLAILLQNVKEKLVIWFLKGNKKLSEGKKKLVQK